MTIIEKLRELGFENGKGIYHKEDLVFALDRDVKDRFDHDLLYVVEENKMLIVAYKSEPKIIEEKEFLENHNGLATGAIKHYLKIKELLKDFELEIC